MGGIHHNTQKLVSYTKLIFWVSSIYCLPHASGRAVERGVFANADEATTGLKNLTKEIRANGFPKGSILDRAHADRVLVPVGNGGLASFQVGKNGTAKLKTVLNAE